jgi:hypothetical protein
MNVMWTNAAFGMYMGRDIVSSDDFEPARRREVQLGILADGQCPEPREAEGSSAGRFGLASFALSALTAGRRLVRG